MSFGQSPYNATRADCAAGISTSDVESNKSANSQCSNVVDSNPTSAQANANYGHVGALASATQFASSIYPAGAGAHAETHEYFTFSSSSAFSNSSIFVTV